MKRLRMKVTCAAFVLSGGLLLLACSIPPPSAVPQHPVSMLEADARTKTSRSLLTEAQWNKTRLWKQADGLFSLLTDEPVVLYRDPSRQHGLVYIQQGQIIHQTTDANGTHDSVLAVITDGQRAQLWRTKTAMLLGVQPARGETKTSWYTFELPAEGSEGKHEAGGKSEQDGVKLTAHNYLFYGPEDVLRVAISEQPSLFIVTVPNGSGYSEYAYIPGYTNPTTVTPYFAQLDQIEDYRAAKPSAQSEPLTLANHRVYPLANTQQVHTWSDERGSIVYTNNGATPLIARYVDYTPQSFHLIEDEQSYGRPLGLFQQADGKQMLSYIGSGHWLNYNPLLLEDGWQAKEPNQFYRVHDSQLQVIAYTYDTYPFLFDASWTYELEQAQVTENGNGMMQVNDRGMAYQISTTDLLNYRPASAGAASSLSSLLLSSAPAADAWSPASYPKEDAGYWFGQPSPQMTIRIPQQQQMLHREIEALPKHIRDTLEGDCLSECVDYTYMPVIRQMEDGWYALANDQLHKLQDNKWESVGTWPVTVDASIYVGKGGIFTTAMDWFRDGENWFVVDTFANRVIQLNAQFEAVHAVSLPFPTKIQAKGEQLVVEHANGTATLDRNLRVVKQTAASFRSMPSERTEVPASAIYTDPKTGYVWSDWQGYTTIYNPKTGAFRSMMTGSNFNGTVQTSFVLFDDQIYVIKDTHLVVFDRNGNWKQTFTYPIAPMLNYSNHMLTGDGSYRLDAEHKRLFLVQGQRILEIQLDTGAVTERFLQLGATIGNLVLYENKLYASLLPGDPFEINADTLAELITIDLASGGISRMKLPVDLVTSSIIEGETPLLVFRKVEHGEQMPSTYAESTYVSLPLSMIPHS